MNVHVHSLVLDGVFTRPTPTAPPVFHARPAPTDEEIATILEQVHDRVGRLLRRRGRMPEEPSPTDPVAEQMPLLAGFASASIQERLGSGPRAGHPLRRLRSAAAVVDEQKRRGARLEGFSLHANVAVNQMVLRSGSCATPHSTSAPSTVVCTTDSPVVIVITAYEPKPPKWENPSQRGGRR